VEKRRSIILSNRGSALTMLDLMNLNSISSLNWDVQERYQNRLEMQLVSSLINI